MSHDIRTELKPLITLVHSIIEEGVTRACSNYIHHVETLDRARKELDLIQPFVFRPQDKEDKEDKEEDTCDGGEENCSGGEENCSGGEENYRGCHGGEVNCSEKRDVLLLLGKITDMMFHLDQKMTTLGSKVMTLECTLEKQLEQNVEDEDDVVNTDVNTIKTVKTVLTDDITTRVCHYSVEEVSNVEEEVSNVEEEDVEDVDNEVKEEEEESAEEEEVEEYAEESAEEVEEEEVEVEKEEEEVEKEVEKEEEEVEKEEVKEEEEEEEVKEEVKEEEEEEEEVEYTEIEIDDKTYYADKEECDNCNLYILDDKEDVIKVGKIENGEAIFF